MNFRNSIWIFPLALMACINEQPAQNNQFQGAIVSQRANNVISEAIQAEHSLTNTAVWRSRSLAASGLIAAAHDRAVTESGYCTENKDASGDVILYTWMADTPIAGAGSITSLVLGEVASMTSPDQVGVSSGRSVEMLNEETRTLPGHCDVYPPNESLVIWRDIERSESSLTASTTTEYRTMTCPDGEEGHIVEQRNVIKSSDGTTTAQPWQDMVNNCRPSIALDSIEVSEKIETGLDVAALAAKDAGGLEGVLSDRLSKINCREAQQQDPDHQEEQSPQEPGTAFDTCGTGTDIAGLDVLQSEYVVSQKTEQRTAECSDLSPYRETVTVRGVEGFASVSRWDGNVIYERDVTYYELRGNPKPGTAASTKTPGTAASALRHVSSWRGVSIACQRREHFHISCIEAFPQYSSDEVELIRDNGFHYERTSSVTSWKDPKGPTPGSPKTTDWQLDQASSGCAWREEKREEVACPDGYNGNKIKRKSRTVSHYAVNAKARNSEWETLEVINNCEPQSEHTHSCSEGFVKRGEESCADGPNVGFHYPDAPDPVPPKAPPPVPDPKPQPGLRGNACEKNNAWLRAAGIENVKPVAQTEAQLNNNGYSSNYHCN